MVHDAIALADKEVPDLILLDIMMPVMDGVQTCIEMRRNEKLGSTLIAFLTARGEEYSQIAGLDAGADDYIQKPIRPRLLQSRINALLRRRSQQDSDTPEIIEVDKIRIDPERYEVTLDGTPLTLAKKRVRDSFTSLLTSWQGVYT